MVETLRKLTWIEERHFHGWRCSACAWVFAASGPPDGKSLGEMMENFERLRDKGFANHVCAEHPRATKTKG
jgi:rubredoxin